MFTSKPLSKNRLFIFHFLRRSQRFNCSASGTYHFDVTDLLAQIEAERAQGRRIGLTACLVRATALSLKKHPRLNNRIFFTPFGKREVSYDHINCAVLAARQPEQGEEILLPVIIPNADQLSIDEIHQQIRENKSRPISTLEAYQNLKKAHKLPRILQPLLHYIFRAFPRFTAKRASTYGISSVIEQDLQLVSSSAPGNQTTFFPLSLGDQVIAYKGEVQIRKVLVLTIGIDHYLVDGMDVQRAAKTLQTLLETPGPLFRGPTSLTADD